MSSFLPERPMMTPRYVVLVIVARGWHYRRNPASSAITADFLVFHFTLAILAHLVAWSSSYCSEFSSFAMRLTSSTKQLPVASGKELVLSKSGSIYKLKISGISGSPCDTPAADIVASVPFCPCVCSAVDANSDATWAATFRDIFTFNNSSNFRLDTVSYALLRSNTGTGFRPSLFLFVA